MARNGAIMNTRIAGLGGLGFLALALSTVVVLPGQPPREATGAELLAYFTDHSSAAGVAALLYALSGLCLLAFVAGIAGRWSAHDTNGLGSGLWVGGGINVLCWTASAAVGAHMGMAAADLGEESMRLAYLLYASLAATGTVGTVVMAMSAAALASAAGETRWIRDLAIGVGVLHTASLATLATESPAVFGLVYVAFVALAVWVVAMSVKLLRHGVGVRVPVAADVRAG